MSSTLISTQPVVLPMKVSSSPFRMEPVSTRISATPMRLNQLVTLPMYSRLRVAWLP